MHYKSPEQLKAESDAAREKQDESCCNDMQEKIMKDLQCAFECGKICTEYRVTVQCSFGYDCGRPVNQKYLQCALERLGEQVTLETYVNSRKEEVWRVCYNKKLG